LLRTDEPFEKMSRVFIAADGSEHKIEILADGQQIVVNGQHPDAHRPYDWHGGEPWTTPREDLPYVCEADMRAFLDNATRVLIEEHGFKDKTAQEDVRPRSERSEQADSKWRQLNERALEHLDRWVTKLFPTAKRAKKGGYRVASADLGRGREEDLSFTPQGIKYFGDHDMGDPRHGRRTPIDVVMEWGHKDFLPAAGWLAKALEDPEANKPQASSNGSAGGSSSAPADGKLSSLNERFCVVLDAGKTRVLFFEEYVQQIGCMRHIRRVPTFLSFEDFRNFYCNRAITYQGKVISLGRWWLQHPERRQYDGITFQPNCDEIVGNRLNLWQGWSVEPKPGDWSLMKKHILELLASSILKHFDYIINWLAWAVQHPAERAEVALVFRGIRGSGKGTLGNAMCRIFGQHATHLSSAEHLTGRFNAHLRDACLLFADEAYWPGDKSAEGSLKALITEPEIAIEPKHREIVMVKNMSHVLMASNENWVVPAGEKERRFAVFDVAEDQAQKEEWFGPLYEQLENGGYSAMLYDLLKHDLGDFHPRRIPRTAALLDQQSESLSPLDAWWVESLTTGVLWGADPNSAHCAVSNCYEEEVANDNGYTRTVRRKGLYDQARAISPRLKAVSDHALAHYLKEQGCDNAHRVLRRRGWTFPPLVECRKAWEARFPGWQWRDAGLVAEWESED
jgi:hypothetical protein